MDTPMATEATRYNNPKANRQKFNGFSESDWATASAAKTSFPTSTTVSESSSRWFSVNFFLRMIEYKSSSNKSQRYIRKTLSS
jgi:hypothetical protein